MKNTQLPNFFYRLFKWLCKPELFEELQGDLEEAFEEKKAIYGTSRARTIYRKEVLKMIRPSVLRHLQPSPYFNHFIMFRNYFKTSLRGMVKNPLSSFINVFGLSVAIGVCLLVYTFLSWDQSIDRFHENKDEIYLATHFVNRDGAQEQYGLTPRPLGAMLKEDFVHIKKVCRVEDRPVVLKHGESVFHERIRYVDPEFMEMFTFPFKWGHAGALADVNSIILSNDMAVKYFGEENPVGEDVQVFFDGTRSKTFTIAGVAEAFPTAHAIEFGFLINFENFRVSEPGYDFHDWGASVNATLIQVENPSDLYHIAQGMEKYRKLQNEAQPDWPISSFAFEQLTNLHLRSGNIRNGISYDGNQEGRIGLTIIAIFMLALACFNYINIAVVSAAKRLKEIGIRKVIGANRRQVVVQFLAENVFVTSFALVLGFVLCLVVFMPWFTQFSGWNLEMDLVDKNLWIFLVFLLLFTGIASGIYPAFYISKFDVVKIFKGSVRFGQKNPLTKLFLVIQLVLACITITCSVVFTQNNTYLNNRAWGYNARGAMYIEVADESAFDQLRATMAQNPDVLSTAASKHHLGRTMASTVVRMPDREYEVKELAVDPHYFETLGLELLEGRVFLDHHESDRQAVVVNELFVKNLGLDQPDTADGPVGQIVKIDSTRYEVIGAVKDFHFYDFFNKMQPTIFRLAAPENYNYLSMRVRVGAERETYEALQAEWGALFPHIPFQGGYQDEVWGPFFDRVDKSERFTKVITSVAIMLACLGLYGLVILNVAGRLREFSIRKALGAGLRNIAANISKQYMVLAAVAMVIGAPLSYQFATAYLNMLFAYPIPVGFSSVAISMVLLMAMLLAVVLSQVRKVSKSNPVNGLRVE